MEHEHQFKFKILLKLLRINKLEERPGMICLMDIIDEDLFFNALIQLMGFGKITKILCIAV